VLRALWYDRPVLSRGTVRLEEGHYSARVVTPRMKELAVLTNRFNMLAEALESAREERSNLYRRLIAVQEDERREIANELHDEAGPCLFGITANAASIRAMSGQIEDRRATQIGHRVEAILGISERLQFMNRALLKKLKPGSHGRGGISAMIKELVAGFAARQPGTEIAYSPGRLAKSYGESLDLTVYRCVQEGIVNAIRHGKAERVSIDLAEEAGGRASGAGRKSGTLSLILRDNGQGMGSSALRGFGLTTMHERVKSRGGSCLIGSELGEGTSIRIRIPLAREAELNGLHSSLET
jgi:two-component system sensor histidine kinase UhpB